MTLFGRTLIRSKLLVPSPAGLLHRDHVCRAIEQGLERKLTLVSAPAGYGKTSALVDFAHTTPVPVCWYTTDERDRDLILFVRYLFGAINEQFPGFGRKAREALASAGGELLHEPTAAVADLVNAMIDLDTEFALVLDNYESVDGAFGIREFVNRLLEVLPTNCHLMIAGRALPDVPVTRLVARRQLVGLAERDLRFTPPEIRDLLRESEIEVSEAQARAIATNAEGWITGVLLISDLLREDAGSALLDSEKATSQTYGYLASEVLSRQPGDLQRFLLSSSVLREMSSRLCREALDIDRAPTYLMEAERRGLFLTRFGDDATATYRYHNLFRGFLQERLRRRQAKRYFDLHRQAGAWFTQDHDVDEAVYHYLAAQEYPEATVLMERVAMEWFTRGRTETLLRWTETLPDDVRVRAPWLSLYQSRVLTDRYDYGAARRALSFAESGFAGRGQRAGVAKVYNQRAALDLLEGRPSDAIAQARAALSFLGRDDLAERAHALRHTGGAYIRTGRFAEGVSALEDALELFRHVDSPYDVVCLLQDLTFAFASQGRLESAAVQLNEALPIARRLGSPSLLAGVLNNLGMLRYERGEYRDAMLLYQEGLSVARRGHDTRGQANLADGMAGIYRDVGSYRSAESLYEVAWSIARKSRPGQAVRILAARADLHRWQGDHGQALALAEQARQMAADRGLEVELRGVLGLARGIALAESGELEEGLELLSHAVSFLEEQGAMRELARGFFLLAKAHLLRDDGSRAAAELQRSMSLAEEIGTLEFAVAEGQHADQLVDLALASGVPGAAQLAEGIQRLRAFGEDLARNRWESGDSAAKRLEIYALGTARVVRSGRPVPASAWQAAKAKELFFYILLQGPVDRDAAGLVFWPDLPARKVSNNFHSTLYRVRQAVGRHAVVVKNGKYCVGLAYWCDVEELDALVERARLLPPDDWQAEQLWRRAVELYQGELLPEVDRLWCVAKRAELGDKYVEALIGLGRCHQKRGAYDRAIRRYRQALEVNELREDVHRLIIRAYAEAGRRSDAVASFHRCQEILHEELGLEPSAETTKLCEEIAGKTAG